MTLLQERVETVAETIQEQTYLVIRHQIVIASLTADCAVCALKKRDAEYPGALLAAMVVETGRTRCLREQLNEEDVVQERVIPEEAR